MPGPSRKITKPFSIKKVSLSESTCRVKSKSTFRFKLSQDGIRANVVHNFYTTPGDQAVNFFVYVVLCMWQNPHDSEQSL